MSAHNVRTFARIGRLSALVLGLGLSLAQAAKAAPADAVDRGRATYNHSCAVCHGDKGKGNGDAASALNPRPADLTMLARRAGAFPAARVEKVLKGEDLQSTHTSAMLVWKALFLAQANGDEGETNRRISDLIAFIESIQAK